MAYSSRNTSVDLSLSTLTYVLELCIVCVVLTPLDAIAQQSVASESGVSCFLVFIEVSGAFLQNRKLTLHSSIALQHCMVAP